MLKYNNMEEKASQTHVWLPVMVYFPKYQIYDVLILIDTSQSAICSSLLENHVYIMNSYLNYKQTAVHSDVFEVHL
jgi:hypothetical protein